MLAQVLALALAHPVQAGDASGFDPAAIETCLAARPAGGDCASAGMAACLALVERDHPDLDPVDRQLGCLDASHQAWDARLTATYQALLDRAGRDTAEASLRAMERAWISFRDARCALDRELYGHGTGGELEQPRCLRDETARHAALLADYVTAAAEQ